MNSHAFGIVFGLIVALGCMQIHAANARVCENVPNASFIRHPRGCDSYFVCMNGVAFARNCPDGLMFDVTGICDYPQFVNCGNCSPHGQTKIRVPGTCDRFIQCNNGTSTEMQCSAGQYFDTNTLACRAQSEVACVPAPVTTTTTAATTSKSHPHLHFYNSIFWIEWISMFLVGIRIRRLP